jgi:hypothetical protein
LFTLPFDGRAMLLAFKVKMAEDEVGLLEEAANVVPDQRFDDVGADTWVVAGRAAFFVSPADRQVAGRAWGGQLQADGRDGRA